MKWLILGLLALGAVYAIKQEMPNIQREMKMMAM